MAGTLDQILKDALSLPDEGKESLAQELVAYLGSHMDPALQREHHDIVKKRRDELLAGSVEAIDGAEALRRGRHELGR